MSRLRLAILAALLTPMAFGAAQQQDPGPCDPVLIDLTELIPQPEPPPPPQPECRSLVFVTAVGTDEAGQAATRAIFLSPAGYAPVLVVLDPDTGFPGETLDLGLASIDCLSAGDGGQNVFVVSAGVLYTYLPVLDLGVLSLQLFSSVVVGPVDDVIGRPGTSDAVVIGDDVIIVDPGTGTVEGLVVLDGNAVAGAFLSDPSMLVVMLEDRIALVDLDTLTVIATKPIGPDLGGVAVCEPEEPETGEGSDIIFVSDRTTQTITAVDAATMTVVDVVDATNPGGIETGETGPAAVDLALVMGNIISVRDCNQDNSTFLDVLAEIVLVGTPTTVVMGPPGTDISTFVGTVERKTVVVLNPDCLTNAPRVDAISPTAGVAGTVVTVMGEFPDPEGTRFIFEQGGFPLAYVSPLTISADLSTFEIPLELPEGLPLMISVTRSSQEAVMQTGNYLRSPPRSFETLGVVGGIEGLIADLELAASNPATPAKAKKQIDKAIEQLQKVLEKLAQGDIAGALEHFKEALEHLQEAIDKGGDVALLARRLLEIVQFLLFDKLSALAATLGQGHPLLADAQTLFDIGRGALLSGDLESALDAFSDGLEELEAAVAIARTPPIDESRALAAGALDAIFDAVEIIRWREPALTLTENQKKELDKIVAHLGPRRFGFEDTALEGYVTGDFEAGGGHVKQAVKRLEDLIAEGVPVFDITKRLVIDFVELAQNCADSMAQRVGQFDEVVVKMYADIAEAQANLNPNFGQGINAALSALGPCDPPAGGGAPCSIDIVSMPVPPLVEGTSKTPSGPPYGGQLFKAKYGLLKDPPASAGYFRLRVRNGAQVIAVLEQGQRIPGIYESGWNGQGFSLDPLASLFSLDAPELVTVPVGTYEMQYVYFCLLDPVGIHIVESRLFSIVQEPPALPEGPLEVLPAYMQFMGEQGASNPPFQVSHIANNGTQTFDWSREANAGWLTSAPEGGTLASGASQQLSVLPNTEGLAPSEGIVGVIEVSAATSNPGPVPNSPQAITVQLTVLPAGFQPEPGVGVPPGGESPEPTPTPPPGEPGGPPSGGAGSDPQNSDPLSESVCTRQIHIERVGGSLEEYLPVGHIGGDELKRGEFCHLKIWWDTTSTEEACQVPVKLEAALIYVSHFRGSCTNSGTQQLKDFYIENVGANLFGWTFEGQADEMPNTPGLQVIEVRTKDPVAKGEANALDLLVSSFDWGGTFDLVVIPLKGSGWGEVILPVDTDDDLLPDAYESQVTFWEHPVGGSLTNMSYNPNVENSSGLLNLNGEPVSDWLLDQDLDFENPPNHKFQFSGDGLNTLEEYRGVLVKGNVGRTHETVGLNGIPGGPHNQDGYLFDENGVIDSTAATFLSPLGITWHRIDQNEMTAETFSDGSDRAGFIDQNPYNSGTQRAIWIKNVAGIPGGLLGLTTGSVNHGFPIQVDEAASRARAPVPLFAASAASKMVGATVAHELGHITGADHPDPLAYTFSPGPVASGPLQRYWIDPTDGSGQTLRLWGVVTNKVHPTTSATHYFSVEQPAGGVASGVNAIITGFSADIGGPNATITRSSGAQFPAKQYVLTLSSPLTGSPPTEELKWARHDHFLMDEIVGDPVKIEAGEFIPLSEVNRSKIRLVIP